MPATKQGRSAHPHFALNLTPPPARLPVCDTTNQAKFIGILYHENNLTPHVFTS
jgi:hypothetical protein